MSKHFLTVLSLALIAFLLGACGTGGTPAPATPGVPSAATKAPAAQGAPAPSTGGATTGGKQAVPQPPSDGSRPLAKLNATERADRFGGPATTYIKPDTAYVATIVTSKGDIVAELFQDAPQSVNNFVTLAMDGFYDGLTFHRVEPNFVIQGGDPKGTGGGGPGYTIPAEIKHQHTKGALAWARTDDQVNPKRDSSGSQFYVTLAAQPGLDGKYTVFGQVTQGMDVAAKIAVGDKITRIDISEAKAALPMATPGGATAAVTAAPSPTAFAPTMASDKPLAKLPVEKRENYYNTPPAMTIDVNKSYQATIDTAKGKIVVDLDAKSSPKSVNNFVVLSRLGFYDGLKVPYTDPAGYVVFGSPSMQSPTDIGYSLDLEVKPGTKAITGTLAMYPSFSEENDNARASGSIVFIAFTEIPPDPTPVNPLGMVSSGMDVARALQVNDIINTITISEK